jgi:RNA polymerase sigma-70 factor, ECF subfamily
MIDLKDAQLLAGTGAEEEACFAELVRRHQKGLYDFLKRLCLDHASACDLVQKTWLGVFRSRSQFQGRSSFKTWLFSIALNKFRDWKRQRRADRLVFKDKDDAFGGSWAEMIADPGPQALENLVSQEMKRDLLKALDALPENYRQVLTLLYQQGLTIKETAGILNKTPDNIKITSYRALRRHRKILGECRE